MDARAAERDEFRVERIARGEGLALAELLSTPPGLKRRIGQDDGSPRRSSAPHQALNGGHGRSVVP
jgi:hypothetical protein